MRKFVLRALPLLAPGAAFAQTGGGLDVSSLVTTIEGTLTPINTIGLAVLAVFVGVKVLKWIRRAM